MNEKGLPNYPELNRIALLYPNPQILLGDEIYWTEKRDGSQLRIGMVDGEIKIATHHQDDASTQFKGTNGFCDNPVADFNFGAVIFGELLSKGKSPARFEHHDKFEFVIFDIWSTKDERFLTYNNVYQHAYHYSLPVVECWAITRHTDLDSLYATRDEMLALAKEKKREGVVLKNYHSQIIKIDDGAVHLPRLPDSEVLGAIAKVHVDLGESFMDKKIAMPTIAKYVSEEQDKHLCSKPSQNLFSFYQKYIEGLVK
jgi:ATP-dependent RNA circularization protein (DNA/RNA ligase family)